MSKIFIDGQVGTTGLQIVERLQARSEVELLEIPDQDRKNLKKKKEIINSADIVVLCLPDVAAKESVALVENSRVKILDASTAHRTSEGWTYGLPEISKNQRSLIEASRLVSIPGCYPTGFLLAVKPLVLSGIVPKSCPLTVNAVSGFSGGGRQLIERYQERESNFSAGELWSYRPYGFQLNHKHLPEMQHYSGLEETPLFVPAVGHFHQGMLVTIPLPLSLLKPGTTKEHIFANLKATYENERFIRVIAAYEEDCLEDGFLSPVACNGTNQLDIMVFGHDTQVVVIARLDNLGKGASGAAVQNLNIMMGLEETKSLV